MNSYPKLTVSQIRQICRLQLGGSSQPVDIEELPGGTLNETWLLTLSDRRKVVLRAAPPQTPGMPWDEIALMRREIAVRPAFEPVHYLMPEVLASDFTQRLIPRDYMLQTFLEGRRWSDLEDTLPFENQFSLWRELGQITARIHCARGADFGYPPPGRQFSCWSSVILNRLEHTRADFERYQLDCAGLDAVQQYAQSHSGQLDQIHIPRLLHGDLWPFNILIDPRPDKERITGILDADRAWWGDPLADWGMFLLALRLEQPAWQGQIAAFQQGYGQPIADDPSRPRVLLYRGMHIALAAANAARCADGARVQRGQADLLAVAGLLSDQSKESTNVPLI